MAGEVANAEVWFALWPLILVLVARVWGVSGCVAGVGVFMGRRALPSHLGWYPLLSCT